MSALSKDDKYLQARVSELKSMYLQSFVSKLKSVKCGGNQFEKFAAGFILFEFAIKC
jgi:hypothetical protein